MIASAFALAVRHRLADLAAGERFLVDGLGFEVRRRENGSVVLENGALGLILEPARGEEPPQELTLEVVSDEPESAATRLAVLAGLEFAGTSVWVTERRRECRLTTPYHLQLVIFRELNEDELAVPPALVTSLLWPDEVTVLVQSALRRVPLAFRANSRERVVADAESAALASGRFAVEVGDASTALLDATPEFRRQAVVDWLADRGVACQPGEPRP